jgi:hypothetical protein
MNMKHKFILALCIAGMFLASACSDFLKEHSQDEVIPTTTTDFRELLVGSGYPIANSTGTDPLFFLSLMDDDIEFFFAYGGNEAYVGTTTPLADLPTYTWQPLFVDVNGVGTEISTDPASTPYYSYYERIKGCNAVLDYIDDAIGTQEERDRVKAEALAVRAYYYFQLVNLYGEPYSHNPRANGVPLKLDSGIETDYVQTTVAAVYEQIITDLAEASRLMDPLVIVRKDYHINQPAIHILLSRVYLHMERWEDCVREANKAFDQGIILVDTAATRMLAVTNGPYGEILQAVQNYNNPEIEWSFGSMAGGQHTAYTPNPEFIALFDPADVRYRYGFSFEGAPRFQTFVYKNGTPAQSLRAAEAYLNRAEANAQLDNLTPAMADLNELRRHRIVGYVNENIADKQTLIDALRLERRKEFCYEGFRWFDLRRYGMPAIQHRYKHEPGNPVVVYTLQEKDPMYTLPYANSLLVRNPSLVQNPSGKMGERLDAPE